MQNGFVKNQSKKNGKAQNGKVESDPSVLEHDVKKKEVEHPQTSVDLGVDTKVPNTNKMKGKCLPETAQQEVERHIIASEETLDSSVEFKNKKTKKKDVRESELPSTEAQLEAQESTKKKKHKKKEECRNLKIYNQQENEVSPIKKKHIEKSESKKEKHKKKDECELLCTSIAKKKKKNVDDCIQTENLGSKIQLSSGESTIKKKCKKKKKESECENLHSSEAEVSKKHKKRKHLLESEEQENERYVVESEERVVVTPKRKKQHVEIEIKEVLPSPASTEGTSEKKNMESKINKNKHIDEREGMKQQSSESVDRQNKKVSDTKQKGGVLRLKEIFSLHNSDSEEDEDASKEEVTLLEAKARIIKDKNRLSCTEQQKLGELKVTVPWPVPPLHMIETSITMRPNKAQREKISDLGVAFKTATYYSKMEDEQITKNWKEFCRMHDLPEDSKPFQNMVNPDGQNIISVPERLKFARFLAHDLNDRLLCSVYKRFRRLFPQQELKTGSRFTPEEDQIIMKYIKKSLSRTPYADLGALLGRNKLAVEKRARILGEEASFGNLDVKWNDQRIKEFVKNVMDVTKVNKMNELESRQISNEEWRLLEKRLNIPVRKLQKGWACRIFPTLFAQDHPTTMKVKISLVRILLERGEDDFKTVDWTLVQKELGKDGHGFTGRGLHELLQGMINHWVPAKKRNDAKTCLNHLQQVCQGGGIRGRSLRKIHVSDEREIDK